MFWRAFANSPRMAVRKITSRPIHPQIQATAYLNVARTGDAPFREVELLSILLAQAAALGAVDSCRRNPNEHR